MNRRGAVILVIILVLGGALFVNLIFVRKSKNPMVKTAVIIRGNLKSYLSTSALIKSKNIKDYYGLQLRVNRVNVKVGDNVKKGDILISYDSTDLNNAVDQAEINYSNALLQKKILQRNNDEIKSLDIEITNIEKQIKELTSNPSGAIQVAELQTSLMEKRQKRAVQKLATEEQFKQADNTIASARLALQSAKSKIEGGKEQITADFDGVITAVNVTEGGVGNLALPAATEMDLNNLKAVVSAGKYDAAKIAIGQQAEIRAEGKVIGGKVSFIEPVAKKVLSVTGGETALNVEVDILDLSQKLKVDFDVDISILVGESNNVIKVPAEAIKSDKEGRSFVYIIENGKAVEKNIKLGIQSDMESEVIEGLKEGQRVILNPISSITNGTLVQESNEG